MANNSLQLYRTLPLNDSENTQLFTFKLALVNLDDFKKRSVRSTIINYQGQDWYLSCKYAEGKRHEFLGVYVYWGSPAEGVRCRADFRIITRNILDPTKSLVTEGSQVEFSAPQSPGWGKREFAPLRELLTPGQGFLLEPEKIVIIELAMKSCSTLFEQSVDFAQLLSHREQPYPSFFTSNFPLAGMEFYLSLYPLGDREEADGNVSMYLHRFLGNDNDSSLIGCRIRYRFFLGHSRTCPSSSKTFEFSFKNEQGYGRFKAFEPLNGSDNLLYRGAVPLGVEIVSITPFAQPEIRLTTRGYYHTDNFVFEDAVFPDHRGNVWRLSATNGSQFLSLRLDAEDKNRLYAAPGFSIQKSRLTRREDCTKFVQWRAFVLSRTDRKKTLAVNGCPLSAYFSRGLTQTNYAMSTQIPLIKAKALDGDYCTKDEPSLLVRIEFLNVQDINGVMSDYPTLDFERFQLYHTREGLKRCLKQNELLVHELESLHGRLSSAIKESKDSRELVQDFQKLLKVDQNSEAPKEPFPQPASARPASLSSSPTILSQQPTPRPRGMRGPPPRPPPRAYSPVATDLVTTRQFTYGPPTTVPSSSTSPSTTSPPPAYSAGMAGANAYSRLAPLNSNDTAFKRFSFTGINITPAMISGEAAESSSRNTDVPAASASGGKEFMLQQPPPPSQQVKMSPASNPPSVVMSKVDNEGLSRGFALAKMSRPPTAVTSSGPTNTAPEVQTQPSAAAAHRLSWPNSLSIPTLQGTHSTGSLNEHTTTSIEPPSDTQLLQQQHAYSAPRVSNSGLTNGFQNGYHQSVSSPNIATNHTSQKRELTPEALNARRTQVNNMQPHQSQSQPNIRGRQGDVASDPNKSPTVIKGFAYAPVPASIVNRRSPVQEPLAPVPQPRSTASEPKPPVPEPRSNSVENKTPQVPVTSSTSEMQPNQGWPASMPVPQQSMALTSDSSLNQASIPGSVVSRDHQSAVQEEATRHAKSVPTTPTATRNEHKSTGPTSVSTPTTPTKSQAMPPAEVPPVPANSHSTWRAGLSASRTSIQSLSNSSLNQNNIYEPLPALKTSNKMASSNTDPNKEYLLEPRQRPASGMDQLDANTHYNIRPGMQNNTVSPEDMKRWSVPSFAERQRMGVFETSL